MKANMPKLRADFAYDLYDRSVVDPKAPDRADIPSIQGRLLEVAQHDFGEEAIKRIYVSKVTYIGG